MPETTMTALAWRFDAVGTSTASSETYESTKATPDMAPSCSATGPAAEGFTPASFVQRWNQLVPTWLRERLDRSGGDSTSFEEILHDFARIIETAENPAAVEAALLRQARRMVPKCRIELTRGPAPTHDRGPCVPAVQAEPDSEMTPSGSGGAPSCQSMLEVPLRSGSAVRGWLRIRSRTQGAAWLRRETIERLTTLCIIGTCALERLGRDEEWPEEDQLANLATSSRYDVVPNSAQSGAQLGATTRLRDATFLNAVLPFALNQARRHSESLSLLCVAIDRLGGLQELLGLATADELVSNVAGKVAAVVRESDIVARLDDDRVIAVLPRAPGGAALHVAQKICEAMAPEGQADCEITNMTVSIGVAAFPAAADNVFSLFDAADEALARAQGQGRNRACLAPRRRPIAAVNTKAVSCRS
jgi:diguanylate cyclase (GGDEF)-like protein